MKQTLSVEAKQEVLSLISGVAFANVPSWYGATRRDLKMDILAPKVRENAAPRPALVWICGGAYMVVDRSVWVPEMQYLLFSPQLRNFGLDKLQFMFGRYLTIP